MATFYWHLLHSRAESLLPVDFNLPARGAKKGSLVFSEIMYDFKDSLWFI
jgi:hypothetical protein